MRTLTWWILLLTAGTFSACGHLFQNHKHLNQEKLDTSSITNPTVKEAMDAFQAGESAKWLSLFSEDAVLLDDGNPRDLEEFSTEAIKIERFTSIDKIEDKGTSIYGQFHSDIWGDFRAYFKFHFNEQGKINL